MLFPRVQIDGEAFASAGWIISDAAKARLFPGAFPVLLRRAVHGAFPGGLSRCLARWSFPWVLLPPGVARPGALTRCWPSDGHASSAAANLSRAPRDSFA